MRAREAAVVAATGVALFLVCCGLVRGGLFDHHPYGDVHLYATYSHRITSGELPYRGFFDEYPPLAQAAFVAPRALGTGYATTFKWLMALCGAGALALMVVTLAASGASRRRVAFATAVAAVAPMAVGPIFLNAYDLWPALLTAGALAALVLRRSSLALFLLGLAVAAKVYPLAALPVVLVFLWRQGGRAALRRPLGAFAGALLVTHLPFAVLGPGGLRFSYWVQLRRGLHVESLGGSLLLAAQKAGAYSATLHDQPPGSKNVLGAFARGVGVFSTLVEVAAILLVTWLFRKRGGSVVIAFVAAIVAFVAFGKVFSPQFVDWLVPLVPLAGAVAAGALLGVLVLTQALFDHYPGVYAGGGAVWILVARNLLVVALAAWLVRRASTA